MPLPALPLLLAAAAAQAPTGSAESIDQLAGCRAIAGSAERLGCFDRLAERIVATRKSGEMIVLDRAKVIERKRARFGLSASPGEMLGGGPDEAGTEVRELTTTVTAVQSATYGRFNLQLGNNTVWQTLETLEFQPRTGAAVTIKTTPFGGYRAYIKGEKPVLAKRVR